MLSLACFLVAMGLLIAGLISDAMKKARQPTRQWRNELSHWPDAQPRPFTDADGFRRVTLDELRAEGLPDPDGRVVLTREGGFRVEGKKRKRKKHGRRKWKNR